VLGLARGHSNGAHREVQRILREKFEKTLEARRLVRENYTRLALEALSTTINERNNSRTIPFLELFIIVVSLFRDNGNKHLVEPAASFYRVKTSDNNVEILVEFGVIILNLRAMSNDVDARDAVVYELRSNFSFRLSNISGAE
jgi:hypothetical protein